MSSYRERRLSYVPGEEGGRERGRGVGGRDREAEETWKRARRRGGKWTKGRQRRKGGGGARRRREIARKAEVPTEEISARV